MANLDMDKTLKAAQISMDRRNFARKIGYGSLGVVGAALLGGNLARASKAPEGTLDNSCGDTAQEVFTAALIAEDLATTFYLNVLAGPVRENSVFTANPGNLEYIRAALEEEIMHADLLRSLVGISSSTGDPYQTFYFAPDTFAKLGPFFDTLEALESAFIGAYLAAVQELAEMAADSKAGLATQYDYNGNPYTSLQLEHFAQDAAAIMGVETEHRVLGRVIANQNPANNLCYQQTDGITCVYNGSTSAVVALTPFLGPGTGLQAYDLQTALSHSAHFSLPCTGAPPLRGK